MRATGAGGRDLGAFTGGTLSREAADDRPLAAADRHHYRVASVSSDTLILAPSEQGFVDDRYRLISDPRLRSNWAAIDLPVDARQPLQGIVPSAQPMPAIAIAVQTITPGPDPLAMLPPGRRPPAVERAPVVEVQIDRHLLEPDLFAEGTLVAAGQSHRILYSTSDASGPARIGLDAGATIVAGTAVTLAPPAGATALRWLTIQAAASDDVAKVPGGEIAFDVVRDGEVVTYVARVVSDIRRDAASCAVLTRMSAAAAAALQPGVTRARYFASYQVELGVSLAPPLGTAAPIALTLPPGASSVHLYLAVTATDDRGQEGALSSPAQVVAVKRPPSGAPSRPFPCGQGVSAAAGYATPPDRRGRATVCLAWDAGSLAPADAMRYEVARTVDSTIVATHRRNWWQGRAQVTPPLVAGPAVVATIAAVSAGPGRGLFRVSVSGLPSGTEASAFAGGRLVQPPLNPSAPSPGPACFQITRTDGSARGRIDLVVRAAAEQMPAMGPGTLEAAPSYASVTSDRAALAGMAADNPDSFGVVTGVPIATTRFTDEIAGIGRSQFLYRARAVDAADNRSAWSPVSAPFFQVDTSAPPAPSDVHASSGTRSITLRWPLNPSVDRYAVHRGTSLEASNVWTERAPVAVLNAAGDAEDPLRVVHHDAPLAALGDGATYVYAVVAERRVATGPSAADVLILHSAPSTIVSAAPVDPDPPEAPDDLAAARTATGSAPVVTLQWSASTPLEYRVRRRLATSVVWSTVSDWLDVPESGDEVTGWIYRFVDEAPVRERTIYQVVARNHAGRTAASNDADAG